MSLTLTIKDDTLTKVYPLLEVPLTKKREVGKTEITTLNGNVYTDYIYKKFVFEHKWAWMSEDDYRVIEGFYDRQFINHKYPIISIPELGIENMVCAMELSDQEIVSNCGTVENVTITLRETTQI